MGFIRVVEGVKITVPLERLMGEAVRRYCMFARRDGKSLAEAWVGLGTPSQYRPAVEVGVMVPVHSVVPRADNWYKLTPRGVLVLAAYLSIKNFKAEHGSAYEIVPTK